jgi:DNA topoisomerase-2
MAKKSIEETYKKLTQREHVLHRPNMYIGEVKKSIEEMWVFDVGQQRMIKKMVEYSPGFLKVFDEVLTNALDHSNRDSSVDKIKLDYDVNTGEITVYNTGTGIPVVEHKEHNLYVPEIVFGHLLSSSNYDDSEKRTGAGVNGLGVKLANIYSARFVVDTVDDERGLKFVQDYTNNMETRSKPKITKNNAKGYTKVTFLPDYARFGMSGLEADTIGLLNKRIYDCIACTNKNVSIFLNGEKLKGKGLTDYVKLFFTEEEMTKTFTESCVQKVGKIEFVWEYIIVPWERFEHVSFVNGNSTYQGGKHVDHVLYQITNKLKAMLETKRKLKDVKPAMIREKMFLFLRATVVNPQFSSQTKEMLTTQAKDFGCKVEVSEKFIDKLWKSPIIDEIVEYCKLKETLDLKQTDGKKKSKIFIPKLEDALWAGTAKSDMCTLILTEGDSAKTFALWGRSVVGPERFGVFPLKGKLLNVRDATVQQLLNNEEINNLKQIIGLRQDKDYKDTTDLRYSKVMCLTDADADGSHIKGLLINFIHANWPSLIKLDFIQTLKTPIVKAVKGKKVFDFFTQQDYMKWRQATNMSGYQIRYYKGLGTSTKEDAQNTFKRVNDLQVNYFYKDSDCDNAILLAFEKDKNVRANIKKLDTNSDETNANDTNVVVKCSDKRKKWLGTYDKDSYIDVDENRVSFQDFIHKELIHFSIYDNLRSIPSLCDGLKPSQRKIMFYMLKKNITKSIKVAQLSGYVSAETSYHHGETSLQQAIIGMGQDFVGSNNINLLAPDGNFGSRLIGGKDAASPRYIFTHLSSVTPHIFNPHDAPLLTHLDDDGQTIEPEWYVPVIPMVLVNGCEGIGTGYSTFIPPYNPRDIIANIVRVLDDKQPLPMKPYYRGFNGELAEVEEGCYLTRGRWERIGDSQVRITELPVGTWVTVYKEFLESLIESSSKRDPGIKRKKTATIVLKDVKNKTTDENTGINFIIDFKSGEMLDKLIETSTLEKELKLCKTFNTNNMYLFDDRRVPTKYTNTTDILLDFYDIRLDFYIQRRQCIITRLGKELSVLKAKTRFINEYMGGSIEINRKSREFIMNLLEVKGYPKHADEDSTLAGNSYDYLVKLPIMSLTLERIADLERQTDKKQKELEDIQRKSEKDLWREDLASIERLL